MIACKQEHFLPPEMYWGRVIVGDIGKYPEAKKKTYPVLCNHCKKAVCVDVCPAGASARREDGIVTVDPDRCIGCRSCVIACPYQQRTFLELVDSEYFPGQGPTAYETIGRMLYPLRKGTVVKCNFCMERIDKGIGKGLKPGIDREATPACVNTCPVRTRYFGDLDDAESHVSRLIRERKGFLLHPEWDTEPSVFYLDDY